MHFHLNEAKHINYFFKYNFLSVLDWIQTNLVYLFSP